MWGEFASGGFNLVEDIADSTGWISNDLHNIDPQLGGLANNGGPTETHLPQSNSPVVDKGLDMSNSTEDQRNVAPTSRPCRRS